MAIVPKGFLHSFVYNEISTWNIWISKDEIVLNSVFTNQKFYYLVTLFIDNIIYILKLNHLTWF